MELRGIPLQWFKDCLSNRFQYVQRNDCKKDEMTTSCGVPQGSVLGPLKFLLYVILDFVLFADDKNVFFLNDKNLSNLVNVLNSRKAYISCR